MEKFCPSCLSFKATTEFGFHKTTGDGLSAYCKVCKKKRDGSVRLKLRDEALKVYGEKCKLCGIAEKEFLAIDHVAGGGCRHRKSKCGGGWNFCRWLKKNGYPAGYRVLCHNCNKLEVVQKENATAQQRWWKKLKIETLTFYGKGKLECICCGESRLEVLSIDHVHGGGTAEIQKNKDSIYYLYIRLRKQGFPEGYQTLCLNCNMARGFYGRCPHGRS